MFPIRSPRGQVIGFGGRVIDQGEPKYLNSPETPLFSKGRELYGLYEAREGLRRENQVIVVEGYMDVVMLAQHGVDYAVATLGTATSLEHLSKLIKLVDRVVFCFDGDVAGRRAAWKALNTALPLAVDGKRFEFLFLPPEHDPDSFVRAEGAAGLSRALELSEPLSACLMRELVQTHGESTVEDRSALLAAAIPLLIQLPLAALRMQLSRELADRVHISVHELNQLLQQQAMQLAKRQQVQQQGSGRLQAETRKGSGGQSKRGELTTAGEGSFFSNGQGGRPAHKGYGLNKAQVIAPRHEAIGMVEKALVLLLRFPALKQHLPSTLEAFWPEILVDAMNVDRQSSAKEAADLPEINLRLDQLCATNPDQWTPWRKTLNRAMAWVMLVDEPAAASEFQGALLQLADQKIRALIDELVSKGLQSLAERERYEQLMAHRKAIRSGDTGLS
jgi:DNA primase